MSRGRHAMPLELADFPVDELRLGGALSYSGRTLEVDEAELVEVASRDPRILSAGLDIVRPGERVRVTGIRDIVEPRVKVDGGGQVFPGITNPVIPVGAGRTHRLSGMTLITTAEYEGTIRTGTTAQRSSILDMWGPGARSHGLQPAPGPRPEPPAPTGPDRGRGPPGDTGRRVPRGPETRRCHRHRRARGR